MHESPPPSSESGTVRPKLLLHPAFVAAIAAIDAAILLAMTVFWVRDCGRGAAMGLTEVTVALVVIGTFGLVLILPAIAAGIFANYVPTMRSPRLWIALTALLAAIVTIGYMTSPDITIASPAQHCRIDL